MLNLRNSSSLLRNLRVAKAPMSTAGDSFQVAVVGSGPAGFYLAQHLLRHGPENLNVDIYEKLPVPFGLVRYGVAPDHQDVKNVDHTFSKVAQNPRLRFVGNVAVGRDVKVSELQQHYNAVVLAYGAARDRTLDVPGENLKNILSARQFVSFYNGLPGATGEKLNIRLDSHDTAVVVGVGNVALDVARMLLTPIDLLMRTDITDEALDLLKSSKITRVRVVGRRGPLQVAFTVKELREMVNLPGCIPRFHRHQFEPLRDFCSKLGRPRKRLTELMVKTALDAPSQKQLEIWGRGNQRKEWHLDLLKSPVEFLASDKDPESVGAVKLVSNEMTGDPLGAQEVVETGASETIECGLVLKSIGYKSVRVEDHVPYDEKKGVVPNQGGRVDGVPGMYCAGWLATGPRGVIVDTMTAAYGVAQNLVDDLPKYETDKRPGFRAVEKLFSERNVRPVSFQDWERIDAEEKAMGETHGKPREKFTDVEKMVSVLRLERRGGMKGTNR